MTYTLLNSRGLTVAQVSNVTKDSGLTGNTSITLLGKNYLNYGKDINENFIRLLENFAYNIEPIHKQIGQVWWDTGTNLLKIWDGNFWRETAVISQSQTADPAIGNFWYDVANGQLNIWTGTTWLLVGPIGTSLELSGHLTAAQYISTPGNLSAGAMVGANLTLAGNITALNGFIGNIYGTVSGTFGNMTPFAANVTILGSAASWWKSIHSASYVGTTFSGTTGAFTGAVTGGTGAFSGAVSGTTGTFTGNVSAANLAVTATISGSNIVSTGNVSAVAGVFSGAVSGTSGTFTGNTSAANLAVTATIRGSNIVSTGNVSAVAGVFSGAVSGTTGTFTGNTSAANLAVTATISASNIVSTGNVSAVAGAFSGAVSGTTGTFTGNVSTGNINMTGGMTASGGMALAGNISASNATITGNVSGTVAVFQTIYGNVVGNVTGTLSANSISTNVLPITSNTYSVGSAPLWWSAIYGNVILGNVISATSGTFTGVLGAASSVITGNITAANVTATSTLRADNGVFGGNIIANIATFSGAISATSGTFSSIVSPTTANNITLGTTVNWWGSVYASTGIFNDVIAGSGAFAGAISATYGRFTGNVYPTIDSTYHLGGPTTKWNTLYGITGTFSGNVNAQNIVVTGKLVSTVVTGTPPVSVVSTTLVPNLYVSRAALADSVASAAVHQFSYIFNGGL